MTVENMKELSALIEEGRKLNYSNYLIDVNFEGYVYDKEASRAYSSWERRVKNFAEENLPRNSLYNALLSSINDFMVSNSNSICDILTDIYNDLIKHY